MRLPNPFSRNADQPVETRAEGFTYTDALVSALLRRSSGQQTAFPTATGALESCAGTVARGFASADVVGRSSVKEALTPSVLAMIGRTLIRTGEIIFLIDIDMTGLRLWPAASHDVSGDSHDWVYNLNIAGPSAQRTYKSVSTSRVLHFRYASDPDRPWRGIGPLTSAALAGRLSAETMAALPTNPAGLGAAS